MIQLHNIEQEYLAILNVIEEAEGEMTPEMEKYLTINGDKLESTVVSYKGIMDILESNMEMADKEIKRVQAFKALKQNAHDRFKKALLQALLLFGEEDKKGIKRLQFETLKLSTRKSVSVEIEDEGKLDAPYYKIDVINLNQEQYNYLLENFPLHGWDAKFKPVKKDIKAAIDSGVEVEGASLTTRFGLTIK